ncbi:hypothetical protein Zmor_020245 [Zophobas morio]|uniref:Uncharacterized protein n=1 Tax=Zophobas morio TaxID=2755281 RepID=A0AA38M9U3_9CUCU|nr:hypothetical protein Zmor_020245 [Zophobas morio]
MAIEALDDNLIAQLRSSSSINSVTQCVTELVLNSLDAKSSSIAVRVNLSTFRIQVVDNGRGISRSNLESVGVRYMTTKCHTLEDLKKHLKYYGFKGEALANIAKISHRVTVTTRQQSSDETCEKTIEKDDHRVDLAKIRASFGTTVTVEGFLNNLPVRQQCVKTNELENIKRNIESLIIIHPRVSFTLRNDVGAKLLLSSVKCPDIASSFKTIHPEVDENDFALLKVSKNKISVEGFIHKECCDTKRLQYIYVNKRPITCPKIQNLINTLFKKCNKSEKKKNPIFVIHIKCPYSDVDVNLEPTKTVAFFKKFDTVKRCIEKLVNTYLGAENIQCVKHKTKPKDGNSEFGVSQIGGVVRGFGVKRKSDELDDVVSVKSARIIDDTPFMEEPKIPSRQTMMALPIEIRKSDKKEVCETESVANNSLFTNFPENEKKGKGVIMDMFILSLKAFPAEQDNVEKHGPVEVSSPIEATNKVSSGVQTSFNEVRQTEMVSVGVQTNYTMLEPVIDADFTFFPRKPLTKFISDYDFDFSQVDVFSVDNGDTNLPVVGNMNQTRKLFDFRNHRNFNVSANFDQRSIYTEGNYIQNKGAASLGLDLIIPRYFPKKKIFPKTPHVDRVQKSPYFVKKTTLPVPKKPVINNETPSMSTCRTPPRRHDLNFPEMTFIKKNNTKKRLNESSISKYFTPKNIKSCTKLQFLDNKQKDLKNASLDESKDLFQFTKSTRPDFESDLVSTEMKEYQGRENKYDNEITEDIIAPTVPQAEGKWVEEINSCTNHPKNSKIVDPKKDSSFEITERFEFVPKGLSPILKNYGHVDDMSPESKEQLQNALIQSYEDELLLIKWQNYISNKDPKKFFEEIYLEKSKLIENSIPNITKCARHRGFENMSFTKSIFKNLEVIGQVDNKFIAALEKTKNLVLLFDQHAVHERVRLEELSESYKSTSTKLDQQITIFLPQNELTLLKRQKVNISALGLGLDFFTHGITISEVPLCVYNKSKKGVDVVCLTETLIKEIIETLKLNNGIIVSTPKIIQNIVNSEACRGAIKFGDLLSRNECIMHLKKLTGCNLPFQCAHGRPTLTPLINLNKSSDSFSLKAHLCNLK